MQNGQRLLCFLQKIFITEKIKRKNEADVEQQIKFELLYMGMRCFCVLSTGTKIGL